MIVIVDYGVGTSSVLNMLRKVGAKAASAAPWPISRHRTS